jgi:hypothetical protein
MHDGSMLSVNFLGSIKDNEESYKSNQVMESIFCRKFLYKVDLILHRLFQQCLIQASGRQQMMRSKSHQQQMPQPSCQQKPLLVC